MSANNIIFKVPPLPIRRVPSYFPPDFVSSDILEWKSYSARPSLVTPILVNIASD